MTTETVVVEAVSQVGFPIVAFLLMYSFARQTVKENTEAIRELRDSINRSDFQSHRSDD